jgi:hypothetical protein
MLIYFSCQAAARLNRRRPSFLPIIEHRRIARRFPGDYKFASQRSNASGDYRQALAQAGLIASMSRSKHITLTGNAG